MISEYIIVTLGGFTQSSCGSYADKSLDGDDTLTMGSMWFRPALHRHTVVINRRGTLTLLITGKPMRRWGFYVGDKLIKRDKWFAMKGGGHHPCDQTLGEPVRKRPDGSRVD